LASYVQGPNSDNWHWCKNCTNYPQTIVKRRDTRPTSGDLCNQCKSKEREGICRT
jgi:hypothetical protein